ncbi:uncharacterized protein LOC115230925 [Octopus sinensis]|uniref:Uncharacterized protein LOC115230925 n=1 Tax=Octopus sinensis TaxID=2607531 RepID=A0A6P7U5X0_9MOLL|nr:uncharacterized protein LOC115230925 [Octopus sinensis]
MFNGYDFGNHLISVTRSTSNWYPVDGGNIKIVVEEHLMGNRMINVSVNVNDNIFIINKDESAYKSSSSQLDERIFTALLSNGLNIAVKSDQISVPCDNSYNSNNEMLSIDDAQIENFEVFLFSN